MTKGAKGIKGLLICIFILILALHTDGYPQCPCNCADSFDLPVSNIDIENNLRWDVPYNGFGNYYEVMGGYHPGEDWNAVGGRGDEDLGKPVRAIGNGKVVKKSLIGREGQLGYLIAIEHMSPPWQIFLY